MYPVPLCWLAKTSHCGTTCVDFSDDFRRDSGRRRNINVRKLQKLACMTLIWCRKSHNKNCCMHDRACTSAQKLYRGENQVNCQHRTGVRFLLYTCCVYGWWHTAEWCPQVSDAPAQSELMLDLDRRLSSAVHNRTLRVSHHSINTRHRASTSMYSLTFRVCVASPAQYGRNGTASLQITSHTPNLHVDFIAGACGVRWAWRITAGLCHAFP